MIQPTYIKIDIRGEGTPEEIITSLKSVILSLEEGINTDELQTSPIEWEDPTLFTIIDLP